MYNDAILTVNRFLTASSTDAYTLSQRRKSINMSSELYQAVLEHFRHKYPGWPIHSRFERQQYNDSIPLTQAIISFDYVILNGYRYYAANQSGNMTASVVSAETPWSALLSAGRLLDIFQFQQNTHTPPMWLARIHWFKLSGGPREAIWNM